MENIKKNNFGLNIKHRNKMCFFYYKKIIFIIKIISFVSSFKIAQERPNKLIYFSSEIHLLILGSGNQSILNDSFYLEPSEVIVNGISRNS